MLSLPLLLLLLVVCCAAIDIQAGERQDAAYARCLDEVNASDDPCVRVDSTSEETGCSYSFDVLCMVEQKCRRMEATLVNGCQVWFERVSEKGGCTFRRDPECARTQGTLGSLYQRLYRGLLGVWKTE